MKYFILPIIFVLTSCNYQPAGSNPLEKTEAQWKKELKPAAYSVLRQSATEKPFSGKYLDTETRGTYRCAGCQNEVFRSANKYHSGTGWPAFDRAIEGSVKLQPDNSDGMQRTEVRCKKCDGHLGHRFDDGPLDSTGKRFCINSAALELTAKN